MLRKVKTCLSCVVLFSVCPTEWEGPLIDRQTIWKRGTRKCATNLGKLNISSCCLGSEKPVTQLAEDIQGMAANCREFNSCCHFLFSQNYWKFTFEQLHCISFSSWLLRHFFFSRSCKVARCPPFCPWDCPVVYH